MIKGLEMLEKAKKRTGLPLNKEFAPVTLDELDIIEKELRALEIINTKEVNVALLKNPCVSLKEYNVIIKDQIGKPFRLTKEEYDLLKEVLL